MCAGPVILVLFAHMYENGDLYLPHYGKMFVVACTHGAMLISCHRVLYMPVSLNTLHGEFEQPCR